MHLCVSDYQAGFCLVKLLRLWKRIWKQELPIVYHGAEHRDETNPAHNGRGDKRFKI